MNPDDEVKAEISRALPCSHHLIDALVAEGWVVLKGNVEWSYQRERAAAAAQRVPGVKGVVDLIALERPIDAGAVRRAIGHVLDRSGVPMGRLRAWAEREPAQRAA